VCHSTVDNSLAFGIGHRLDGWANRDLDVGKITAAAPNLQPVATLLGVSIPTVQAVLNSWGPGKFDAQLFLDGKAFNPQQVTDGVVTGINIPGATLLPNAYGLVGFNQHTWTGAWGNVTYWNAFVANLELHGTGRFFDPRLNNATQFPIAAANGFGDLPHIDPDDDLITKFLPALHFYQLAIPAPTPRAGVSAGRRRRSALLNDMRQLVSQQPGARRGIRAIHPAAEHDIGAVCIRAGRGRAGRDRGGGIRMHAHSAEVVAEPAFE
jgi:hypothetical protein